MAPEGYCEKKLLLALANDLQYLLTSFPQEM